MSSIFFFQNIHWREPLLLLLAFQPVVIILLKKLIMKNSATLYAEKKLQPWVVFPRQTPFTKQIFNKNTAYIFGWLLIAISLAGPRIPLGHVDKEQVFGMNIMLVVDLSLSMKAIDIEPSRLRRTKIEIYEFLEKAQNDRVGITVFSARPHLFVPLTSDHSVIKTYLESLDKLSFPTMGSDPVSAILFAKNELANVKGKSAIILLTDGDFSSIKNNQLEELQLKNIPLYILGIGSVEGEAIKLEDGTWLKHNQQHVVSRMNEDSLQKLAAQLNGKYSRISDDDTDWNELYEQGIKNLNSYNNIDPEQRILWKELFPYFLFPSLLLFWFSLSTFRFKGLKNNSLLVLVFMVTLSTPENEAIALELGQTTEQQAYRAYLKGNFTKAETTYQNIKGFKGYFGYGNSLYKKGRYQKAIQQFTFAVINSQDDTQRANALYNLANSYFRTGNFDLAISTYKDVLRYQPENKYSLHNVGISQIFRENIEKRLKDREEFISSPRQGRGPRSASVADGTDIGENTSVSLGESKNKLNDNIPLPELPGMNKDVIEKLVLSGLKNIKLAGKEYESNQQLFHDNNKNTNLIKTQQQLNAISDAQHLLWKRLFEMEEGFPAPVETPRTIKGVKPW